MVEDVVKEGAIGGGDIGVLGDTGHRVLGESSPNTGVIGLTTRCCWISDLRLRGPPTEPDRTSCFSAATGDAAKPKRGELGVAGTDRAGECPGGGMTEGSW
jgi:hypothetical protein